MLMINIAKGSDALEMTHAIWLGWIPSLRSALQRYKNAQERGKVRPVIELSVPKVNWPTIWQARSQMKLRTVIKVTGMRTTGRGDVMDSPENEHHEVQPARSRPDRQE
jgi:hypothetical protein